LEKAWTGKRPWTILELLGCVEEVERRMTALPIMSFALDQWRAFWWMTCWGSEARAAENELRRSLAEYLFSPVQHNARKNTGFSALSVSVNYKRSSMHGITI
jgi:hypothetical protein